MSVGNSSFSSISRARGATTSSANLRAVSRTWWCSSFKSRSMNTPGPGWGRSSPALNGRTTGGTNLAESTPCVAGARIARPSSFERIALDQPPADGASALDQVGARDHAAEVVVIVLPGDGLLPASAHPFEESAHALLGQVVAVLRAERCHEHPAPRARPQRAERGAAARNPP